MAGVLKLLRGVKDRRAKFVSAIAYADKNGVRTFTAEKKGKLVEKVRGKSGFAMTRFSSRRLEGNVRAKRRGKGSDIP